MAREAREGQTVALRGAAVTRNPYGVMDVPNPNDQEVVEFAANTTLDESSDDEDASAWSTMIENAAYHSIEGTWSSRWNGGADPTIPGDAKEKWKQGQGEVRLVGNRIYLLRLGQRRAQRAY